MLRPAFLAVVLASFAPSVARAGATTPTLLIQSASVVVTDAGARTATFAVAYDYSNAVQADYDLELIVYQGERFARFPISGPAQVGTSAALGDGLEVADLPALDAAAGPAGPGVRIVTLQPTRLVVALPASFSPGPATAAFVAGVDEGTILSNPLGFVVP